MASGHVCLNLSTKVRWNDFPEFAETILEKCKGIVIETVDAVDIRMWRVKIGKSEVRLVFDDYPVMVSMESSDDAGDQTLKTLSGVLSVTDFPDTV